MNEYDVACWFSNFSVFFCERGACLKVDRWVRGGGAHTKGIVFTQDLWCGENLVLLLFRAWLGDLGTQFGR
jgi:hypothetical protein